MNEELYQLFTKTAFEDYVDTKDKYKKKSGWNMKKLQPLLNKNQITVEEFIRYAKERAGK